MKPLLTPSDRQSLSSYLQDNAPDDILIRAVEQVKEYRENVRTDYSSLRKYLGTPASEPVSSPTKVATPLTTVVSELQEADPPGTPVQRISTKVRSMLLAALKQPHAPSSLGNKFSGHLKLLWTRGEIKWNGKEYYI